MEDKKKNKNSKKVNINLILVLLIIVFSTLLGIEIYVFATGQQKTTKNDESHATGAIVPEEEYPSHAGELNQNSIMRNETTTADAKIFIAAVKEYQSSNNGNLPKPEEQGYAGSWLQFNNENFRPLINETVSDYGVRNYEFDYCKNNKNGGCMTAEGLSMETFGHFYVITSATCKGNNVIFDEDENSVALLVTMLPEINGERVTPLCVNN